MGPLNSNSSVTQPSVESDLKKFKKMKRLQMDDGHVNVDQDRGTCGDDNQSLSLTTIPKSVPETGTLIGQIASPILL